MLHNKTTIASALVILFGILVFYVGTDGFHALTSESARKYELVNNKPTFPEVTLEDSSGRTFTFDKFARGKYVFVTFMYTNCGTVCPVLEMNMAEVYDLLPSEYIGNDIVFLSISFDSERDNPETLAQYGSYFGSDGETWRMARIKDQYELDTVLDDLGITVIPDGQGDFQHNVAFYLFGKQGHLLEVMDFSKIEEATNTVVSYLNNERNNR